MSGDDLSDLPPEVSEVVAPAMAELLLMLGTMQADPFVTALRVLVSAWVFHERKVRELRSDPVAASNKIFDLLTRLVPGGEIEKAAQRLGVLAGAVAGRPDLADYVIGEFEAVARQVGPDGLQL